MRKIKKSKKLKGLGISKNLLKILQKIKSEVNRIKSNLTKNYNKFKHSFKTFKKNNKELINSLRNFCLLILGYGFIINYALHFLLGFKFNLFTLTSWGVAYYFIDKEFIEWFGRLKR